ILPKHRSRQPSADPIRAAARSHSSPAAAGSTHSVCATPSPAAHCQQPTSRQAQPAARSTGMPGCPDGVPTAQIREQRRGNTCAVEHLAGQLAAIPGVVAVTLGGSRAAGAAAQGSDWDFGLYYRDRLDPADVAALGWPGRVFAPGEWGRIVNGGAWLDIDGTKVDLIYRDLGEVLRWTAAAEDGRFEIHREVGYVAGIATYILAGELALGRVLAGELPRPRFPQRLRESAPAAWFRLAAGALHFADVHAGRQDRAACLANLCQAALAAAQGRLAAAGEWALNEKRLVERAGLGAIQDQLGQPEQDLGILVSDVSASLGLRDSVWIDP